VNFHSVVCSSGVVVVLIYYYYTVIHIPYLLPTIRYLASI
jgi:hypothetical protein